MLPFLRCTYLHKLPNKILSLKHNIGDRSKEFLPLDWLYSACLPILSSGFLALVEVDFCPLLGLVSPFYIVPPVP